MLQSAINVESRATLSCLSNAVQPSFSGHGMKGKHGSDLRACESDAHSGCVAATGTAALRERVRGGRGEGEGGVSLYKRVHITIAYIGSKGDAPSALALFATQIKSLVNRRAYCYLWTTKTKMTPTIIAKFITLLALFAT